MNILPENVIRLQNWAKNHFSEGLDVHRIALKLRLQRESLYSEHPQFAVSLQLQIEQ